MCEHGENPSSLGTSKGFRLAGQVGVEPAHPPMGCDFCIAGDNCFRLIGDTGSGLDFGGFAKVVLDEVASEGIPMLASSTRRTTEETRQMVLLCR